MVSTSQERRQLITGLFLVAGALVMLHLLSLYIGERSWQFERAFRLDLESNIPTWFSSSLFVIAALAAYRCARASSVTQQRKGWAVLAVAFLLMSCDEVAMLHENLDGVLRRHVLSASFLSRFPSTSWPVLVGPFLLMGLAWLAWRLGACVRGSPRAARLLILGAIILLAGAVGVELTTNLAVLRTPFRWWREAGTILEESLEMLGSIMIIAGLLVHHQVLQQQTAFAERRAA